MVSHSTGFSATERRSMGFSECWPTDRTETPSFHTATEIRVGRSGSPSAAPASSARWASATTPPYLEPVREGEMEISVFVVL
jgi:hypothetical protein